MKPSLPSALPPGYVAAVAARALDEDLGRGDATTSAVVPADLLGRAVIRAREPLVVAGIVVAAAVFRRADTELSFTAHSPDGSPAEAGDIIAVVEGRCAGMLAGERTALNFLQRLSGVATLAARASALVRDLSVILLDTRKTTPGLRLLEKEAARLGGIQNHRGGLDDGILIKDNHVACCTGPAEAVRRARARASGLLRIEVEIDRPGDLESVVEAGADVVLLDNFSCDEVAAAVRSSGDRVVLEASGGITLDNLRAFAATGVHRISLGFVTHSAPAVDLSLELSPEVRRDA
jgi:nicotinate-nucleotide pyrophosphorylase (carboxylating)